jgi:membrane carboxypeptidase/penicillin-binding protein
MGAESAPARPDIASRMKVWSPSSAAALSSWVIAGCIVVGITIAQFGHELTDYQQLVHYQPAIMTRVHAGDGRLLAEYAAERRVFVPIEAIPKRVVNAFLSAEDKNSTGTTTVSIRFLFCVPRSPMSED